MIDLQAILGKVIKPGFERFGKTKLPPRSGKLRLGGMKGKADIYFDQWDIPHIYASNLPDLSFAQGYVHATNRLWQMEMYRRVAAGTLCELLGAAALDVDIASRTFGFARLGKTDLDLMEPQLRTALEAYVAGVNAGMGQQMKSLPVEFSLLRFVPKPWTLEDSMAFSRLMGWQMSHAWQSQLIRGRIVDKLGPELASQIEIHYSDDTAVILEDGVEVNIAQSPVMRGSDDPLLRQKGGSNSWAVSPGFSATGGALLANDPHLGLSAPGIWYENHLHCPELHVTGVGIAGFPMVFIGHNEHIAWGITLAFTDCEDVILERFDPVRPLHYQHGNEWLKANTVDEPIYIKGKGEPHVETVVETVHGPIVSHVVGEPDKRVALQSVPLQPRLRATQAWWQLNTAKNRRDFVHAVSFLRSPQLNLVFADTKGNIGYWLTGAVPVRAKGDGKLPMQGWTGEHLWKAYVPFMEMPHAFNPKKGYVLTANNKAVNDDYPHYLGDTWMNGYRAKRLSDLFSQKNKISREDCRLFQTDLYSLPGKEFAGWYAKFAATNPKGDKLFQAALHLLAGWDAYLMPESVGGAIYEVTRYHLIRRVLMATLKDGELTKKVMGIGFNPALMPTNELQGHDLVAILRLLGQPENAWMQNTGGRNKLLHLSLLDAVDWLGGKLGKDPHQWQWGKLHRAVLPHAMSIQKPMDKVFNIGPFPLGGDGDTPWQANFPAGIFPNGQVISASYRMVVDLNDFEKSVAVMPPGQSGHVGSPHYADQMEMWLAGKLRPMLWSKQQVEMYAKGKVELL